MNDRRHTRATGTQKPAIHLKIVGPSLQLIMLRPPVITIKIQELTYEPLKKSPCSKWTEQRDDFLLRTKYENKIQSQIGLHQKTMKTKTNLPCPDSWGWLICQWTICTLVNNLILIFFSRNMIPINIPEKKRHTTSVSVKMQKLAKKRRYLCSICCEVNKWTCDRSNPVIRPSYTTLSAW